MDCSLTGALPKPKTVSVNGVVIPRDVIAREVQNHPAGKPIEAWQEAARALVVRELLLQEARRLDVTANPLRDAEGRSETDEEAAIRALIEREVEVPEPDEASCRRFYEHNRQRFQAGELYEAAHILIAARPDDVVARRAARQTADSIMAAVKSNPVLFDRLAHERSDCRTSAENGGRLGQLARGQTVAEFDAALARMAPDDIAVVETRYGFHVVRLDRYAPGRILPFELVQERIAGYLVESVRCRALAQYVSILAGGADIAGVALSTSTSPLVQ